MVHAGTPSCCRKTWTQCWTKNDEGCVVSAMLFMSDKGSHLDEEVHQLTLTCNHLLYVYNYGKLASDVKNGLISMTRKMRNYYTCAKWRHALNVLRPKEACFSRHKTFSRPILPIAPTHGALWRWALRIHPLENAMQMEGMVTGTPNCNNKKTKGSWNGTLFRQ